MLEEYIMKKQAEKVKMASFNKAKKNINSDRGAESQLQVVQRPSEKFKKASQTPVKISSQKNFFKKIQNVAGSGIAGANNFGLSNQNDEDQLKAAVKMFL